MATINPSTGGQAELKLADKDPEVRHSGSSDRFTVKFTIEGVDLRELENVLTPRLPAVGVKQSQRFGMTMSLSGVEAGREGEVSRTPDRVADVHTLRQNARDDRERSRSATEAADAVAEGRLDAARERFHAARESGSPR